MEQSQRPKGGQDTIALSNAVEAKMKVVKALIINVPV